MLSRPTSKLWVDNLALPLKVPRGRRGFTAGAQQGEAFAERTARRGSPWLGVSLGLCVWDSLSVPFSFPPSLREGLWAVSSECLSLPGHCRNHCPQSLSYARSRVVAKGDSLKNQSQGLRPTLPVRSVKSPWLFACMTKVMKTGLISPLEFFLCHFQNSQELQSINTGKCTD